LNDIPNVTELFYVEARIGRENHRGNVIRYIRGWRDAEGVRHQINRPAEEVIAELLAAVLIFGQCRLCKGSGVYEMGCTLCGDSTYDHYCNDKSVPCDRCAQTGISAGAQAMLENILGGLKQIATNLPHDAKTATSQESVKP